MGALVVAIWNQEEEGVLNFILVYCLYLNKILQSLLKNVTCIV
jgi:hypothetical protein